MVGGHLLNAITIEHFILRLPYHLKFVSHYINFIMLSGRFLFLFLCFCFFCLFFVVLGLNGFNFLGSSTIPEVNFTVYLNFVLFHSSTDMCKSCKK